MQIKIEGDLDRGWTAEVEGGPAEGAVSYGNDLKGVLSELGSVIEVLSMRDRRRTMFAVPQDPTSKEG